MEAQNKQIHKHSNTAKKITKTRIKDKKAVTPLFKKKTLNIKKRLQLESNHLDYFFKNVNNKYKTISTAAINKNKYTSTYHLGSFNV